MKSDSIVLDVPVHQIRPNPTQPRIHFDIDRLHELRISMRCEGQIVPIFLRRLSDVPEPAYEIIDGERRWRAASLEESDIPTLKAIVLDCDEKDQYIRSCAVNFNRESHTPYEEIQMIWTLVREHGNSMNYVASLLGKSITWVNQRILARERLDESVMREVRNGKVPISVATTLSKLLPSEQRSSLSRYMSGGSITDVQSIVRKATDEGRVQGGVRSPDMKDDKRYILKSAEIFTERFKRHKQLGEERLASVVSSMSGDERDLLVRRLGEAGREVVALMVLLKSVD